MTKMIMLSKSDTETLQKAAYLLNEIDARLWDTNDILNIAYKRPEDVHGRTQSTIIYKD